MTIRAWDPPHFDPYLTVAYKTTELLRAEPPAPPQGRARDRAGTFALEGDLAARAGTRSRP